MNEKGVVTVFLVIILPVVLVSCILLTDAAVFKSGCDISEEALSSAAYSVLGKYSSYLFEKYEIYGFESSTCNEQYISGILKDNLSSPAFYDFKVEQTEVKYMGCLVEPDELGRAILSVSGDDLYQNLIDEFLDRFNILEGFRGYSEILKMKMQVDDAVRKFKEAGELLDNLINGIEGDGKLKINGIDIAGDYGEDIREIESMLMDIKSKSEQISELRRIIESEESEEAGQLRLLEESKGMLMEKVSAIYSESLETAVVGLSTLCSKAIECIETMVKEKERINIFSGAIDDMIERAENLPEYIEAILLSVSDIVRDVENETAGILFDAIEEKITGNLEILIYTSQTVETFIEGGETAADIDILDVLSEYDGDVVFGFTKSGSAGREKDKRSFFEELGKRVLEKRTGKDVEIEKGYILPSEFYETMKENPEFRVISTGEDTESAQSRMDAFAGSGGGISQLVNSLKINEYLLNHLSYETSDSKTNDFFKNEIEYILWGARSQNLNKFYTKSALMGTRFALNAIHVYTDAAKKLKADAIAAATAGWWTIGAGIPVMSNLVKCSWAIAESGLDVRLLCDGRSVAILKRKADWITDIGLKAAGIKTPEFMQMDYEDYMRLYLMMSTMDSRMSGLADIIQLNSVYGFDIIDTYTSISIKAVISFRSIAGKRHEKTFEITIGYEGGGIS